MRQELAKRSLPDINSLYNDVEIAAKRNDLNILLNQAPGPEWVKKNKFANDTPYIPIQTIEYLLTAIFLNWKVEIKNVQVIANSVVVMVRLHYQDPTTENWEWQDGVGAAPIQTKSGASATDFTQVTTSAVQMAAPAAESYAIKDAAEKLGKLFGKDISRKDAIEILPALQSKSDLLNEKLSKLS